jgi:hypothetical protein
LKVTIGEERSRVDSNFRRIQSNYGQTEDGKNALVVADGDDGENSPAMLIQEREQMSAREDRVD